MSTLDQSTLMMLAQQARDQKLRLVDNPTGTVPVDANTLLELVESYKAQGDIPETIELECPACSYVFDHEVII